MTDKFVEFGGQDWAPNALGVAAQYARVRLNDLIVQELAENAALVGRE